MAGGSAARFTRNSAFGTVAGALTALSSVVASVIVAHALGVASTGFVALVLWVAMIAATMADLGVQASLARYLPELIGLGRADEAEALAGALWRWLACSCAIAIAGFVAVAWWRWRGGAISGQDATMWGLAGLACATQVLSGFTFGYLRGIQRFDRWALLTAASFGCNLAGVAVGSICFGAAGALGGYCAGGMVPAALSLGHATERRRPSPDVSRRVRRYALYAWAAALSSTLVWSRAELFFLERSTGDAAAGLFTVSVTLANFAAQGPMLLTTGLLPFFAQSFGEGAMARMREGYAAATRVLALLVLPVCFGLAALLPTALPMIYGRAFADAVPAAVVLVLASGIGAVSSVATSLIMATDRSDFVFVSGILATVLALVCGLTVIPTFGLMGAAWSRAAIQLVAVALGNGFLYWRLGVPMPLSGLARLLAAAALCGAVARCCLQLVPGRGLALVVAVAAGAVAYVGAVRALRALSAGDAARLAALCTRLPGSLAGACARTLDFLAPGRPPATFAAATAERSPDRGR